MNSHKCSVCGHDLAHRDAACPACLPSFYAHQRTPGAHLSDCATHNAPALAPGACDCGFMAMHEALRRIAALAPAQWPETLCDEFGWGTDNRGDIADDARQQALWEVAEIARRALKAAGLP